jgi:hypothetical protein
MSVTIASPWGALHREEDPAREWSVPDAGEYMNDDELKELLERELWPMP